MATSQPLFSNKDKHDIFFNKHKFEVNPQMSIITTSPILIKGGEYHLKL